jgi:hypothetical protein
MRAGFSNPLIARLRAVPNSCKVMTEAVIVHAEDLRDRQDEWDAATTTTGISSWASGFITLDATNVATISYSTGSDHLTTITGTRPFPMVVWEVDDAIGDGALLREVSFYLNRKKSGAVDPFDGAFICRVFAIEQYYLDEDGVRDV